MHTYSQSAFRSFILLFKSVPTNARDLRNKDLSYIFTRGQIWHLTSSPLQQLQNSCVFMFFTMSTMTINLTHCVSCSTQEHIAIFSYLSQYIQKLKPDLGHSQISPFWIHIMNNFFCDRLVHFFAPHCWFPCITYSFLPLSCVTGHPSIFTTQI